MRNISLYRVSLFLICICLVGCELAKLGDPVVVSDVENEYNLEPWEALSLNSRSLQLRLSTRENQPCQNAFIDFEFSRTGNRIALSLREIQAPEDCNPGESPAVAVAEAGSLPAGFYNLSVDLENTVFNEGQLIVTTNRYLLNMESTDGFTLLHEELIRVPNESVWGYITFEQAADEPIADAFVEALSLLSTAHQFDEGYYGHFQVSDQNGQAAVAISGRPSTNRIRQFAFQLQRGRLDDIKQLVEQYRDQYGDGIELKLMTWQGREL